MDASCYSVSVNIVSYGCIFASFCSFVLSFVSFFFCFVLFFFVHLSHSCRPLTVAYVNIYFSIIISLYHRFFGALQLIIRVI